MLRQVPDIRPGQYEYQLRFHRFHSCCAVFEAVAGEFGLAPVAAAYHALLGDDFGGDAALVEEFVAVAAVQPVLFAVQALVHEAVHADGEGADGEVDAVFLQAQLQLRGAEYREVQVYGGVFFAVGTDDVGQWQGRVADGGVEHAEVEGAAQFALEGGAVALEAFEFGQQAQGFLMEEFAFAGQAEPASAPVAQDQAELGFELAHVGADGGGGEVEFLLCGGKALMAYHAGEDAQQFEVGQG